MQSRRRFLKTGAGIAAAGLLAPSIVPARVLGANAPSNRITIGIIGCGRQEIIVNTPQFLSAPDAQILAVCDVDRWRAEENRDQIEAHYGAERNSNNYAGCDVYEDFRELLARDDIDAVMISAPDHWHAPMGIHAANAGKHVCIEKPISTALAHGRLLANAVAENGVVSRNDSEFRSIRRMWKAVELVRNGYIGELEHMISHVPEDSEPIGRPAPMPAPPELNYPLWLGPAPGAPYTEQRVHPPKQVRARPGWLRISDYTEGMITNWGTHLNDIVQWANGTDRSGPVSVEGAGAFSEGLWDTIVEFKVHYEYANGVTLEYEMGRDPGVEFRGSEGWLRVPYRGDVEASDPAILDMEPTGDGLDLSDTMGDKEDFLHAIKTGRETLQPAEAGHRTCSLCQIGLIAVRLGRKLTWDPESETFPGDDEANTMLDRPTRGDWFAS